MNLELAKRFLRNHHATINKINGVVVDMFYLSNGVELLKPSDFFNVYLDNLNFVKNNKIKLSDDIINAIDNSSLLKEIKAISNNKMAYIHLFSYIHLVEGVSMNEIKELYNKIESSKNVFSMVSLLTNKPIFENSIFYVDENKCTNYRDIINKFNEVEKNTLLRKLYNELPSRLKKQFNEIDLDIKNNILKDLINVEKNGMFNEFFGKNVDGIYRGQIKRYGNIIEFSESFHNFSISCRNNNFDYFVSLLDRVKSKDIIYFNSDEKVIILSVYSYRANVLLNSHTKHCTKDGYDSWYKYYDNLELNNKQYYIYDFNLDSSDIFSVVGVTINKENVIQCCHLKDNTEIFDYSFLDKYRKYLLPMNDEESKIRLDKLNIFKSIIKCKILDKSIISEIKDLNIDLNYNDGYLINTIFNNYVNFSSYNDKVNNLEHFNNKVNTLIRLGLDINNLNTKYHYIINKDIIITMIDNGFKINKIVYNNLHSVFYENKNLDISFDNYYPLRHAIINKEIEIFKHYLKSIKKINDINSSVFKISLKSNNGYIIINVIKKLVKNNSIDELINIVNNSVVNNIYKILVTNLLLYYKGEYPKEDVIKYINYISEYEINKSKKNNTKNKVKVLS